MRRALSPHRNDRSALLWVLRNAAASSIFVDDGKQDNYLLLNLRTAWHSANDLVYVEAFLNNVTNEPVVNNKIAGSALLGTPILTFFDGKGTKQVVLTTGYNDHGLYFMDADGKDRVSLIALDEEQSLTMRDRNNARRIGLVVSDDDQGLYLMDPGGKDNVSLVTTGADEGLFFSGDRGLYVVREGELEELRLITER